MLDGTSPWPDLGLGLNLPPLDPWDADVDWSRALDLALDDLQDDDRPPVDATPGDPSPGALAQWVTRGRELNAAHLDLIDQAFLDIAEGAIDRVALFMPPRRGKSRRAARWGALWYLRRFPHRRVAIASYGAELAEEHSRWVRDQIVDHTGEEGGLDLGLRVKAGSKAANRFGIEGSDEGGLMAVGVGGAFTGRGADLILIDDPVKNREEADSAAMRKKAWDWYTEVAQTRLEPGGAIILIQTRWHEDDLGGRLLAREPEDWRVISIPEIAERDDDPIGRRRGEPLWPERFTLEHDERTRKSLGGRSWNALYQQRPAPIEGAVWKRTWLRYLDAALVPPLSMTVVAIDPATTSTQDSDDTGIITLGRGSGARADEAFVLADDTCHETPAKWGRTAGLAALRHHADGFVVEDNQGGEMCEEVLRSAWADLRREGLTGGRAMPAIKRVRSRVNKRIRAEPVAALYEQGGRIWHVGEQSDLEDQMCSWSGQGDSPDRLDALVHGTTYLMKLGGPASVSSAEKTGARLPTGRKAGTPVGVRRIGPIPGGGR